MNEVFICFEFHDNGIGNNGGEWKLVKVCKDEEKAIDFVNEGKKIVKTIDPIDEIESWFIPEKPITTKEECIFSCERKYIRYEVE
jgi:hypothetical protein